MAKSGFSSGFSKGFGWNGKGWLSLMVGDHPTYEDGDVVGACNWRRQRQVVAEGICWPRLSDRRKAGGQLGASQPLLQAWYEKTHRYKFERVSSSEIKRITLATMDEEVLSGTPNEKGERINVSEFVDRRLRAGKLPMFGSSGSEVWYGGRKDFGHANLDEVWTEIEAQTGHVETDYEVAPFGDYRKRLVIAVNDFDDQIGADLTAPLVDDGDPENPVTVKKRKCHVAWRDLRDVVEEDVLDRKQPVRIDLIRKHVRSEVVLEKTV